MNTKNLFALFVYLLIALKSNSQVIINEIRINPGANLNSIGTEAGNSAGTEFIELYNNGCAPVDISCYFLAGKNGSDTKSDWTLRFPAGTIIAPQSFLVVGGDAVTGINVIYPKNFVTAGIWDNSNFRGANTVAWLMNGNDWKTLYNANGTAVSAVAWGFGVDDISVINTLSNYNHTVTPINRSGCPNVSSLASIRSTYSSNPGIVSFLDNIGTGTWERSTDGTGNWQFTSSPSTIGTCNGTCNIASSFSISSSINNPTCGSNNGSITITPTPSGIYTYSWTSPAISTTNTATSLQAGTYTISVEQGGCVTNTIITLTSAGAPTITAIQTVSASCGNNDGTATVTATAADSYTWSSGVTSTTNTASNLAPGNYTVTVGLAGCTTNTVVTIGSISGPTITAIQTVSSSCGNNDGTATVTATAADSYTWSSGVTSTTNTASNLAPSNYTVTVGLAGCTTNTIITIGSISGPTITAIQTVSASCGNNDGTATITATAADSYTWSSGVTSTTNTASNLAPGNYTVTVGLAGCTTNTVVTIPTQTCCPSSLTYSLAVSGNTVCNGISIPCNYSGPSILINEIGIFPTSNDGSIYGLGPNGPGTGEGEWIELFNPDWCNSIDISGYILGSFNSTGSGGSVSASNGMAFVLPASTIVPPLGFVIVRGRNAPVPPAGIIDIVVDNIGGRLCIDGGVNTSRLWFQNTGGWFAFYNSNGVPQDMVRWGNPPSNDLNGNPCIPSTNSLPPGFNQLPSATQAGTIVTTLGNPTQGSTFVRIPDGASWSSNATSLNTYGTCNVQGGCVNPGNGSSSCSGQAAVFMTNGQAPYTYLWSTSPTQTTQTASSLCGGNYTLTVKDANLCEEVITLSVSSVVQPTITSVSSSSATCSQSNGSASVTAIPSTATYSWSTGINSTNNTVNNIPAGTYTITVSESPCITSSIVVIAGSILDITVTKNSTPTSCLNNDGIIFITSSIGIAEPFSYSINGLNYTTDTIFNGLSSGTYTITVLDNINCSITQTINVSSADTKPEVIVPNVFTPNNDLKNDYWYVNSICINEYKLTIFNRWGNKIIEFNNPTEKWDGSGANDGTYYYVIEAKGYNNEQINKTGFITITR